MVFGIDFPLAVITGHAFQCHCWYLHPISYQCTTTITM